MIETAALNDFAEAIHRRFGHQQDLSRQTDLSRLLERRMTATGYLRYADYRRHLESTTAEWDQLAPLLTVPETYFFRLPDQLNALAEDVLPRLLKDTPETETLRLLSAGCASGEEPYSMRIVINERFPQLAPQRISITAIDLSEPALEKARAGLYSEWSLRATMPLRRQAHFTSVGKLNRLNDNIRTRVEFQRGNLLAPISPSEPPFHVIFCRNVLIYFADDAIRTAIAHLSQRLVPGGYLFLGAAESLRGISRNFSLCHTGEAFYYRRRDEIQDPEPPPPIPAAPLALHAPRSTRQSTVEVCPESTWFDTITRSSARLASLMPPTPRQPGQREPYPASPTAARPQRFVALVSSERFAEALALLDSTPEEALAALPSSPAQPAAVNEIANLHLLRASMLTNLGRFAEAERECKLMFEADELNAGAHFLYGLCREQAGELIQAEEHMATATFLDPGFSMPHLHRGLIARRRRDDRAARSSFQQALAAIPNEDPARLAILGGGFSRESLIQLCQRELARLGDA